MTIRIFNSLLLAGWLLVVLGVSLGVSLAAGLAVGGALLIGITLLLAFRVGVGPVAPNKD